MFCPSCGTRNPDGSRFCKTCGTDLSSRGAGTTASQAAVQAPVPDTPAFARPTTAAHRHIGRGGVIAGIAAAVAIALVVAAGLRT
ncbi:MAG: zinc-ribbon domain-containing protein, partial [Olsenella sp.]